MHIAGGLGRCSYVLRARVAAFQLYGYGKCNTHPTAHGVTTLPTPKLSRTYTRRSSAHTSAQEPKPTESKAKSDGEASFE